MNLILILALVVLAVGIDNTQAQAIKFYLYYSDLDGDISTQVIEYKNLNDNLDEHVIWNMLYASYHTTVFIIPGYNDKPTKQSWTDRMATDWMKGHNFVEKLDIVTNVFVVDWSEYNRPPYTKAVSNVPKIAQLIVKFMKDIKSKKVFNINDVHLVGHGLGAHIAGLVGKAMQEPGDDDGKLNKFRQITGLDPAGPLFDGKPASDRLSPDDAAFVDVIHTDNKGNMVDNKGFGTKETCGHVDFYPNDGHDQPGCEINKMPELFDKFGQDACSHFRSIAFYYESIRISDDIIDTGIAFMCQDYKSLPACRSKMNHCHPGYNSKCALIGRAAYESRHNSHLTEGKKFYLVTNGSPPFYN